MYIFVSIRRRDFVFIRNTNGINEKLRDHNSGIGSHTSHPFHIFPYSVFAYIYGFNGNKSLMYYIEQKWKDNARHLIYQGIKYHCIWLQRRGNEWINFDLSNYGICEPMYELSLIRLLKERQNDKNWSFS